ncbi:hypothetical protein [Spirosoma sp. KUDC1026]|uniref:hypothetical protein n=1 Tax=Spirosoma sp. KUDC1026 TaxID=2745947 RepID=UPI00159B9FCF|nr:hypothetical protein [Spirosoma sp. KUDC1026]QKZ13354.1 hypothetical protein HU175_12200 [Spirosoma sp. KUDC1026]
MTTPFHCLSQLVYHTNEDCPQGKTIEAGDRQQGKGGKAGCLCCYHLNKAQQKNGGRYGIIKRLLTEKQQQTY